MLTHARIDEPLRNGNLQKRHDLGSRIDQIYKERSVSRVRYAVPLQDVEGKQGVYFCAIYKHLP